jgi:citrate synthase
MRCCAPCRPPPTRTAPRVPSATYCGEAIFAVARTAGWIAHAMEAYEAGILLRLWAAYTGPARP